MSTDRREFLGTIAAVGVSTLLPAASSASTVSADAESAREDVPELPSELVLANDEVDARVVVIHPITLGALPIVIECHGERFQVDVYKRDPSGIAGVVETSDLSLFVANDGDGGVLTGRERELATRALGVALEGHATAKGLARALLTFEARQRRHAGGIFDVLHTLAGPV